MAQKTLTSLANDIKSKLTLPTLASKNTSTPNMSMAPTTPNMSMVYSAPTPTGQPIGVKTKSPTDSIKTKPNTTNQPKTQTPGSTQSTENGTAGGIPIPSYGSDVKDNTGKVVGQAMFDPNTGKPLPNPNTSTAGTTSAPSTPPPAQTGPYTPPNQGTTGVSQGGIIGNLLNNAQNETPEIKQARQALVDLENEYAQKGININHTAGFLTQANGEQGMLQSQYLTAKNALTGNLQNALTARGQGITATTAAGTLNSPIAGATFGLSPSSGGLVGGVGGNGGGVLASAVQLVKNGASIQDALTNSGLSAYGATGQAALTQALQQASNGTFNPTATNAQVQQNITQGSQYQGKAAEMDTSLKQLDLITPMVTNFLASSGLNSQANPNFNKALNTYYGEFLNPGNRAIFEQYMGDVKKFTSSILAAGSGTIPTDVANTLASFDPSLLSVEQLIPYLDNLKKLGSNQLSVLQGQSNNSYGGSGGGYSGAPATSTSTPSFAPNNPNASVTTSNPVIQGLIGGAMNIIGGIENGIKGLANSILR